MTFWKVLRWAATGAFIVLLLASWWGIDAPTAGGNGALTPARTAPTFNR